MPLPDRLRFLLDPRAYPHEVRKLSLIARQVLWARFL